MTSPAAFSGDYVDLRFVKSRKVAQVIVEIPIEQATGFVAAFGAPNPATGVPVALARLNQEREQPAKEKRRFSELPPSQQAAMRCNEPDFQKFVKAFDAASAADAVRGYCGVLSRRDLDILPHAREAWSAMEAEYFAWQRGIR